MSLLPPVIAPDAGTELVSASEPLTRIVSPPTARSARARSRVWPARSSVTATPSGTNSAVSAAVAVMSRERTTVPPAASCACKIFHSVVSVAFTAMLSASAAKR